MKKKVKVGIIGCGNICDIYFKNMCGTFSNVLDVVACADIKMARAKEVAEKYKGVKAVTVKELLADPEISIVVNLTIPKAHFDVSMKAVKAGKSVHCEKPITLTRAEGKKLLAAAKKKKLLVGNAPDTFMGAGIQTCRKLIDEGAIGEPVAATAFMMCHGHESWHPDPEFYYKVGGGPMFDMGPYYLTALVTLLGPARRVTGSTRISFPKRTITSAKKRGKIIKVEVPTHVAGVIDFAGGAIGTIITSFDVHAHTMPCIEIYGSKGSLQVPDPNGFGGPVRIKKEKDKEWKEVPVTCRYAENGRGIGPADMARVLRSGGKVRASGELAYHVLDIMHAIHDASKKGCHVDVESTCSRPEPVPKGGIKF